MTLYLNSYHPLITYAEGRKAIAMYNLPPFIDYSCRREPDFQSAYPSITALCRTDKFVPRLREGDQVVYITVQGKYPGSEQRHWRLVAILDVFKRFESHSKAAVWYKSQGVALPHNCIVPGNDPDPIDMTAPITCFKTNLCQWDLDYQERARQCSVFVACKPQYMDLHTPPIITREDMLAAFNRIPATQTPPKISTYEFERLKNTCIRRKNFVPV